MADATEDSIQLPQEDADPADEVADFRFLTSKKLPSRGTKDFEPHGTKLQQSTLEASRQAMYDVLNQKRTHAPNAPRAVWDAETGGAWVINPSGKWTATVGQSKKRSGKGTGLWLLPEEMLWLVDRGSLDVRWPPIPGEGEEDAMSMSLQGAYAVCIRSNSPHPLSLEMYSVYAYLKRAGYIVLRANSNLGNVAKELGSKVYVQNSGLPSLWRSLFSRRPDAQQLSLGPLVTPGIYRTYDSIFKHLDSISFHDPRSNSQGNSASLNYQLDVTFHVYKPDAGYKKSDPGSPDFYVCIIGARSSEVPSEPEFDGLLGQTPFHAPEGSASLYRRLKDGYRNVILAVVDQGIVSFLNISDAGFGLEKIWKREHVGGAKGKRRGQIKSR